MREGAQPSPSNQARVIHDIIALSKRDNFRVNVIEAFDQPWKRQLEGTVGGHWGLFDADNRAFKFAWGEPVSDHPFWQRQIAGGVLMAALVFGAAMLGRIPSDATDDGARCRAGSASRSSRALPASSFRWPPKNFRWKASALRGWVRGGAMFVLALMCPLAVACGPHARAVGPVFWASVDA